jgi:hypothetical protein
MIRKTSIEVEGTMETITDYVGKAVMIRTVTYHYLGRLVAVNEGTLTLEDTSWVAESGQWSRFLRYGVQRDTDLGYYIDPVHIRIDAVVDWTLWRHELPRPPAEVAS